MERVVWELPERTSGASFPIVNLGTDERGNRVEIDLESAGNLLVVGPTGSGKSVVLRRVVLDLLSTTLPDDVRLILADATGVEWSGHGRIPHLLTPPVSSHDSVESMLRWLVKEVESRIGVGPSGWNGSIVAVIDGIDPFVGRGTDVERLLSRVAERGARARVHLIVSSQPTFGASLVRDVGVNARLVLRMPTSAEMRRFVERDVVSAYPERHIAQLVRTFPLRNDVVRPPMIDETEEERVLAHWRGQWTEPDEPVEPDDGLDDATRELVRQAIRVVVESGTGSTSLLQRRLKVGFARAGRIMDRLEELGIVGPAQGSAARSVMVGTDDLDGIDF